MVQSFRSFFLLWHSNFTAMVRSETCYHYRILILRLDSCVDFRIARQNRIVIDRRRLKSFPHDAIEVKNGNIYICVFNFLLFVNSKGSSFRVLRAQSVLSFVWTTSDCKNKNGIGARVRPHFCSFKPFCRLSINMFRIVSLSDSLSRVFGNKTWPCAYPRLIVDPYHGLGVR